MAGDVTHWVDAGTLEVREVGTSPISNPTAMVTLSSGAVVAVAPDPSGAASVILAPLDGGGAPLEIVLEPTSHDITAVIPLPAISSLAIGGYQAHGAVVVDADGAFLASTAEDSGVQQVEGGIETGRSTFVVGSYGQGRIHSLTVAPDEPVLESVEVFDLGEAFKQARPLAWALVDGGLLIGTAPEQGRLGGVVQGLELSVAGPAAASTIENPADGRSIVGIVAAGESDIVLTTSVRGGYGAGPAAQEAVVMRMSLPDGKVLWKTPVGVLDAYTPRLQQGRVFCATTDGMLVLDVDSGELLAHTVIGEPADSAGYYAARIEPWQAQGRFLHVARGRLSFIDLVDGTVAPGPDSVGSALTLLGDRLYAASGNQLVRFVLPSDPALPDCTG